MQTAASSMEDSVLPNILLSRDTDVDGHTPCRQIFLEGKQTRDSCIQQAGGSSLTEKRWQNTLHGDRQNIAVNLSDKVIPSSESDKRSPMTHQALNIAGTRSETGK